MWTVEEGVRCVVCPDCAFTFSEEHMSVHDGEAARYDCPNCVETRHDAEIARLYKNAEIRGCENNRLADQVIGLEKKIDRLTEENEKHQQRNKRLLDARGIDEVLEIIRELRGEG